MTRNPAPALDAEEKLAWLRLIRSENVGPITFFRLLDRFGTAAAALAALPDLARRGGRSKKAITVCPRDAAVTEIEATTALGVRLVARDETGYPPLLAHIEDPPPLIAVRGDVGLLGKTTVAIVGARNASINGQRFARDLAAQLGEAGLVVVSGLARGIDACAHQGALGTGTAAVVAGGLDVVYPEENRGLMDEIVDRGVVIGESPLGVIPKARHFPRRNRLISGVSLGVVVVEASMRSGSLITARMALEQGREVFAVPGSPLDPRARGANHLIRQGAVLTESAHDVVQALQGMRPGTVRDSEPVDFVAPSPAPASGDELAAARARIEESLAPAPVTVDELVRNGQFSPSVVSLVLLELELAGRLERHPGNQVSLIQEL
jgi:DNA processing protein